jgi:nucleoside-diphosphate-sugar epimerase
MIVGSGLIANSFINSEFDHSKIVVFASGVSNSTSGNLGEYEKEFSLIKSTVSSNADKVFLYFSTTSLITGKESIYVKFKQQVEDYIKENCDKYLILRLPNIVGYSKNNSQLIPYFYSKLLSNSPVTIDPTLSRFLIDVEDIPKIVELLQEYVTDKEVINVYFDNSITVIDIISYLEQLTGKQYSELRFKYSHENFLKRNSFFIETTRDKLHLFNTDPFKIIKKYYENFIPSVH